MFKIIRLMYVRHGIARYGGRAGSPCGTLVEKEIMCIFILLSLATPFPNTLIPLISSSIYLLYYRTPEAEEASILRVRGLVDNWRERESDVLSGQKYCYRREVQYKDRWGELVGGTVTSVIIIAPCLSRQISVLTRRYLKTSYRDPLGIAGTLGEVIAMGIGGRVDILSTWPPLAFRHQVSPGGSLYCCISSELPYSSLRNLSSLRNRC